MRGQPHAHRGALKLLQSRRPAGTSPFNPQDIGQSHVGSLEKSLMSCPPEQRMLSRDMDVLPFRRKEEHPKSHADMSDNGSIHPPLSLTLSCPLWKKHRGSTACASAVPQWVKAIWGKICLQNPPLWPSLYPHHASPFPGFVFWEGLISHPLMQRSPSREMSCHIQQDQSGSSLLTPP